MPKIGDYVQGGFYVFDNIIVAERKHWITESFLKYYSWGKPYANWNNKSLSDGMANSHIMLNKKSTIAQLIINKNIEGYDDWFIPSKNEFEIIENSTKYLPGYQHLDQYYFYGTSTESYENSEGASIAWCKSSGGFVNLHKTNVAIYIPIRKYIS